METSQLPSGNRAVRTRSGYSRAGFTLTELLVVIALIGFIVSLGFSGMRAAHQAADEFKTVGEKGKAILAKLDAPEKRRKSKMIPDQYVVQFGKYVTNPHAEADRLKSEIEDLEVLHVYTRALRGMAVRVPSAGYRKLREDKAVGVITTDMIGYTRAEVTPVGLPRIKWKLTPLQQQRLPIANIGNPAVYQDRYRDVVAAVIDTGVDSKHPDLRVTFEKSFIAGNPSPVDGDGHGTHVAGIIGAINNTEGVVGVVPGCEIWNLRVLDNNGNGNVTDIIAAVDFAAQNADRIAVVNLSLGFDTPNLLFNAAVNNCVRAGVPVVCAAGNNAAVAIGSPETAELSIAVGAMADSDGRPGGLGPKTSAGNDDTFADFSNYGPAVDIVAPGVDILSTFKGQTYKVLSGTSQASPYVAGVVGLMRNSDMGHIEKIRNLGFEFPIGSVGAFGPPSPKFTPDQVRFMLFSAVVEAIPGRFEPVNAPRNYPMLNCSPFSVGM